MYEAYSSQALPDKCYRELLGSALCVFNSNNAFVIENILNSDDNNDHDWHNLIDKESGILKKLINETITKKANDNIAQLFSEIVSIRNRIIHSFQITNEDDEQILATKTKVKEGNKQFIITKEYLLEFIKLNEQLSYVLNDFRGY